VPVVACSVSGARLATLREVAFNVSIFLLCLLLYYFFNVRRFFEGFIIAGDTRGAWSVHFFVLESLIEYLQYPLWDPTTLGGYPSHLLMVNGWYQNLHPFHLPYLLLAAVTGRLFNVDTNHLVLIHKTFFLFSVNLVAVMLITRELCRSWLARLLPPLVYTLCAFQFMALRDNLMVEGLPPALFYLFGLIYHANRRSPRSLLVFLFFSTLYIFGLCYAYLLSSIWWVATFSILTLLCAPRILADSWTCVRSLWEQRTTRIQLVLVLALAVVSLGVAGISVFSAVGEVIRGSGDQPIPYDVAANGPWGARAVYWTQIWANWLVWSPFPDLHANVLKYDPFEAGIHHRYMGAVLLPLLVIALLFGHQRRHTWPLLLTVFIAAAFITYTAENPLYAFLLDNIETIRNTRPLTFLLSREVTLLLAFVAAIGLDILLRDGPDGPNARLRWTARVLLTLLLLAAGQLLLASLFPSFASVRQSFTHVGIYLGVSCIIALALTYAADLRDRLALGVALVLFVGLDLVLSASAYLKLPHTADPDTLAASLVMPSRKLGPIEAGDPPWVGGYRGEFHNLNGGPYVATRTWLVLASHPSWQPALQNWNAPGRHMRQYPDFRFFSNAAYIPFDAIRDIDNVKLPTYLGPPTLLIRNGDQEIIRFPDRDAQVERGFAGRVEHAAPGELNSAYFSGWAIDEKTKRPIREVLIFVGDALWGSIPLAIRRPDLPVSGIALPGFNGLLDGVAPDEQRNIRAFAVLGDGTARELEYPSGYRFGTGYGAGPAGLRATPHAGPPTIYLHDPRAILPETPAREEKITWRVTDWTPNRYVVHLTAPTDGYLLNLDNFSRYWKARVDGRPVDILRANFALQAIKLAKGAHVIEWSYDPIPFKVGWLVYYITLGAVLIAFAYPWMLRLRGRDPRRHAASPRPIPAPGS
jgi:hypothetical protein